MCMRLPVKYENRCQNNENIKGIVFKEICQRDHTGNIVLKTMSHTLPAEDGLLLTENDKK